MGQKRNGKYDLEERLIDFAVEIVNLTDTMPNTRSGNYYGNQLLRSGSSPALNYGEAQASESTRDFIHKMKVVLKELRESHICLRVIIRTRLHKNEEKLETLLSECNELIAIFVSSIKTAQKRKK